jgi:CobQ-like glutamine amidotransferase family enzyme
MSKSVTILHLYPQEMNIYGDRGNILALVKRLEWRGYEPKVVELGVGGDYDISKADIIFGGGGQDRGQISVGVDMQRHADGLRKASLAGVPMLTICGTYQLFGHGFTTLEGQEIPGISIFNARTMGSTKRMIGNIIVESDFGRLVGFENHSGQTLLEASQKTLGKVVQGFGNDGESEYEGAMVNNTFGTYLHGPMLPKNPTFTDHLILTALRNRYGVEELKPLQDDLENSAAKVAASRPQ